MEKIIITNEDVSNINDIRQFLYVNGKSIDEYKLLLLLSIMARKLNIKLET